ncbi:uncharacterized protein EKO05_0007667 [Ascochyta rabiei]|uniref:Uncharacterized protein n=1 Tax=Didymella rabiei TaxID=5454 RepID=A0A162VJZ8_DIDRA|nr:uncharacterized protein EKO05_0007667 [Ascochyta rabiei]KZM18504.1 hypothetical protein ST47_g10358 [Ascochyta rabiei]UPX17301.1 hypothetical protein EKO05_0007667 [Ascochyta rabiei]
MADATPKRSGLRAMFGMRPSTPNEPGARKKLSKKSSRMDVSTNIGRDIAADRRRQDSGSFSSQHNGERAREHATLPTYEDATGLASYTFRDDPYAAAGSGPSAVPIQFQLDAEYRRNSEGLQQYAAPLYQTTTASSARTGSLPQIYHERPENRRVQQLASKPQPSKLSKAHRAPVRQDDILDKDTGERKDLTDMMHAFTYSEARDSIDEVKHRVEEVFYDPTKPDGTAMLGGVSPEIWLHVAVYLSALDVAHLSSTCRTMFARLGRQPYKLLLDPINRPDRLDFLLAMDHKLPRHLFCFPCAQWHLRIQPGFETLKPHNVLNPLFECPNFTNNLLPPPRIRITEGRTLPFAFIQLARRHWAFGPDYGIPLQSLARRWKDPYSPWSHESMYHVTDRGHVLMRVKSQAYVEGGMTTAAKRMLLFSRDDYIPYFSVCSHWKNGVLTSVPKCALDHIPVEEVNVLNGIRDRLAPKKAVGNVPTCQKCRPMRRCPECPTEYLFELKMVEDKTVKSNGAERFKQALVVTRWSDLGPGRSPVDREWAAVTGEFEEYNSFEEIGRRAISGVFESAFTDTIPGQRIVTMNPKKVKANEIGGDWY